MALEIGPPFPCPKCRRPLEPASWRDARHARCRWCETETEFRPYPALHSTYAVVKPNAVVVGDDATCFYHATNQAAAVCGDCGRLLCAVCSVPHEGAAICPTCLALRRKKQAQTVNSRFLWGGAALMLAVLPVVTVVFWYFTVLTAPAAISLAIIGWNKPGSLVSGSHWRHVLAILLGTAQLGGWTVFIVNLATH